MPKNLSRLAAVAGVACLALLIAAPAHAVNVPLLFNTPFGTDTNQSFNGSVNGNGTVQIGGSALGFETIPNQTISLNIPSTGVSSSPASTDALGNGDLTGVGTNQLVDINALDLDMLNGQSASVTINQIIISGIPLNLFIGPIGGALTGLTFQQTGPSVLTGGSTIAGGSGTFTDPGNLNATLALNTVPVGIAPSTTLTTLTLGNQSLSSAFALTGNWTVTPLGFGQRKVSLDGSQTLSVPLSLVTQLISTASAVTVTVALNATVGVVVGYHLQTIVVPEPGSIALLGIGLAALIPVVRRWRKK